jgi:hypothetical protein
VPQVKYLDKSFSVGGPLKPMCEGWMEVDFPWSRRISKGEWVTLATGRKRWYPEGKEIPRELETR